MNPEFQLRFPLSEVPYLPISPPNATSLVPGCAEGRVTFVDGHVVPPGALWELDQDRVGC